tara:strand:+ start:1066 stop:2196 length:1131 start_codon:yes stop_codon:yes gene_type:complete
MSGDIILERGESSGNIMKLDDDEQAFLNDIEIQPRVQKRKKFRPRPRPVQHEQYVDEEIDAFTNPLKSRSEPPPPPEYDEHSDDEGEQYEDQLDQGGGGGGYTDPTEKPSAGFETIEEEKADLLNKISRLEKKGLKVNKRLNIYSNIQELRTEVKRVVYGIEVDQSVKFSRRMMIACITGVEFLNKRYNPFDLALEGWSESIMENVDDYDGVFEELHNKYKSSVKVVPEVKLIMMLGGSAMMFHLTNSMFKTAIPNMNDVLKQNPDLVKNMMSAVQNTQARPPTQATDPTQRPVNSGGGGDRYEMKGPGMDIGQLMGGIMMPPQMPMNTTSHIIEEAREDDMESVSDIVSISGESTRDVTVKPKRKKRSTKKEVTL